MRLLGLISKPDKDNTTLRFAISKSYIKVNLTHKYRLKNPKLILTNQIQQCIYLLCIKQCIYRYIKSR